MFSQLTHFMYVRLLVSYLLTVLETAFRVSQTGPKLASLYLSSARITDVCNYTRCYGVLEI